MLSDIRHTVRRDPIEYEGSILSDQEHQSDISLYIYAILLNEENVY